MAVPQETTQHTAQTRATGAPAEAQDALLARAVAFASPLLAGRRLSTGEDMLAHAQAVAAIVCELGHDSRMQAAAYLVYASRFLQRPQEVLAQAFGAEDALLAVQTQALIHIQHSAAAATLAQADAAQQASNDTSAKSDATRKTDKSKPSNKAQTVLDPRAQHETVRKMLLAFARDIRAVVLRLASRLQTLRYMAAQRLPQSEAVLHLARESLQVFAPLANRLGLGQIKWEMEDLALRFLEPITYKDIAQKLEVRRSERETRVQTLVQQLQQGLRQQGLRATVQGRPKHIYSILKKMRGKHLAFHQVMDICALRCIVADTAACYQALAWLHTHYTPIDGEFDDYIAKPKSNGYQSLHTVVRDSFDQPVEVQIRTQAMHDHAEHGVAAHWAYKEAGSKGYSGVQASGEYERKIATLRQLLAWERELTAPAREAVGLFEDCIYVLTPAAAVIELPQGATPIDFAYAVHTDMGHRCRGAKVDGRFVPLNTPLQNGQTVEILVSKPSASTGTLGPSRDWLHADAHYLVSARARAKVRAWFNALHLEQVVARGREQVEKVLQREGRTSVSLDDLASRLACRNASHMFELVGREELSLKHVQEALQIPAMGSAQATTQAAQTSENKLIASPRPTRKQGGAAKNPASAGNSSSGVLIQGVHDVMLLLAPCCRPMPPDAIAGYVTRGKGVSVHRQDCPNFLHLASRAGARVVQAEWAESAPQANATRYAVEVHVQARDRETLLQDISEVLARHKVPVQSIQRQVLAAGVQLSLVLSVTDGAHLHVVLQHLQKIKDVTRAARQGLSRLA